jgi:hypothetical protein
MWSALGVTTCDQDACARVFAVDSSNCGASVTVGFSGYGAGVEDDDIRSGAFG